MPLPVGFRELVSAVSRSHRRVGLLVLCGAAPSVAGCASTCETVVKGGAPAVRSRVEATVRGFQDRLTSETEMCVPSVRVVDDLSGERTGTYNGSTRRIRLERTDDLTVRHELCHAVHLQNDLPVDGPDWVLADPYGKVDVDSFQSRGEAFAQTCALGLDVAFLLGSGCESDESGIDAMYYVRDLFTEPDESIDLDREGSLDRTLAIPTDDSSFRVEVTAEGIHITSRDVDVHLDPWTGDAVPEDSAPMAGASDFAATTDAELWIVSDIEAPNGATTTRRLYRDAGSGVVPLGCPFPQERVFAFEGWLWSAWLEDGVIEGGYWLVR